MLIVAPLPEMAARFSQDDMSVPLGLDTVKPALLPVMLKGTEPLVLLL